MSNTVPVVVPKVSMAAIDVTFAGWLVADGAEVKVQQPIYTVATDKVETDVESPAAGILWHGNVELDVEYPVGYQVGVIEVA